MNIYTIHFLEIQQKVKSHLLHNILEIREWKKVSKNE